MGKLWRARDGFVGTMIGEYTTREGERGAVLQQLGTVVVHGAFTAFGFVLAEWILVRLIRPRAAPDDASLHADRPDGRN